MATLGEQFKAAREAKGVSEADAGSATKILTKVIVAMEANDFTHMAAPAYAKGFIRLYARYLDLDPEPFVVEYMENYAGAAPKLGNHGTQLDKHTQVKRELPRIPKDAIAKFNPVPLLASLGKLFAGRLKKIPAGPLKDIRVVAGIIAGLLVLAALISTVTTCVRSHRAGEPAARSATPTRMLLEEPLPDLYLVEPGKTESN